MEKLTKFMKEQTLQRLERSYKPEEQVQYLVDLGSRGEKAARDMGYAQQVANLTRDSSDEVAAAAMRTLGDFGAEGCKHMAAVALGLNRSPPVVEAAAVALAMFGHEALGYSDALAQCLERSSDEAAQAALIAALGAVGAEHYASTLSAYLDDKSPTLSAAACQALGKLPRAGAQEASRIARKLAVPPCRFASVVALGDLGPEIVKSYLPEVVNCLQDSDSLTRHAAAKTLGRAGEQALPQAEAVAKLLTSPAPGLRCSAALALGHLRATSYANAVARLLEDPEVEEGESHLTIGGGSLRSAGMLRRPKCAALMSLSLMSSEPHLAAIAGALRDKAYEVRLCALEALMLLGPASCKFSSSIMAVMEDDVYLVRLKACQCIAAIGAVDVMDNLPDLFTDEAPSVRQAALAALQPEVGRKYSSQVFKCITDEYGCVRAAAMRCLANMDIGSCYASTIAGELSSQDPEARAAACEALGRFGDYGAAFMEELEPLQHDEVPIVRSSANFAMRCFGAGKSLENGME